MRNKNILKSFIIISLMVFTKIVTAQEVLSKIDGGASWNYLYKSDAIKILPSTGAYSYITDNDDYTVIDENNGTAKTILLHNGTPGLDIPPHGMIINIVNKSSRALPFNCGGACGYESILGSFTGASIAANSSIVLQWNSGTSRWYEIL